MAYRARMSWWGKSGWSNPNNLGKARPLGRELLTVSSCPQCSLCRSLSPTARCSSLRTLQNRTERNGVAQHDHQFRQLSFPTSAPPSGPCLAGNQGGEFPHQRSHPLADRPCQACQRPAKSDPGEGCPPPLTRQVADYESGIMTSFCGNKTDRMGQRGVPLV